MSKDEFIKSQDISFSEEPDVDNKLREILNQFGNDVLSQSSWIRLGGELDNCGNEALSAIKDLMIEIIGEDEDIDDYWYTVANEIAKEFVE